MVEIFINRDDELELLTRAIKTAGKVLIQGLRGVGKTTLLKKINETANGIYIDFQNILRPRHLAKVIEEKTKINVDTDDPYECLEVLFSIAEDTEKLLIFDEFTELINRFGMLKPYRGSGGKESISMHLRSLLQKSKIPVFMSSTSMKTISEITGRYTKPLARAFDIIITLHPLKIEDGAKLALAFANKLGISLEETYALKIAELTGGNPDYIRVLVYKLPKVVDNEDIIIETFNQELIEGYFQVLFMGLQKELSPSENEVLRIIAHGFNRYSEIDRLTRGINLNEALASLLDRGLIRRIKLSKKEVKYTIVDKTLEAWLAMTEFPGLKAIPFKRLQISTLSFEALIRELFMNVHKPIEIKDYLGRTLFLDKIRSVYRYSGALGEVDAIIKTETQKVAAEIYFGEKCPPEKVNQLLRNIAITEKIEGSVDFGILISYFGFQKETIELAKQNEIIYLLSEKEINNIATRVNYRKI